MFNQILYGLIGITIGFLIVWKTRTLINWAGQVGWAEKLFGPTGTFTLSRIIGVLIIIISFLYMLGYVDKFLDIVGQALRNFFWGRP